MRNEQAIQRLLDGVTNEQDAILAVAGTSPLTDREQALVVATRIFWTKKPEKQAARRTSQFDHSAENLFDACGLDSESCSLKFRVVSAWIASEEILRGRLKQSEIVEKILEVSSDIVECVAIAKHL